MGEGGALRPGSVVTLQMRDAPRPEKPVIGIVKTLYLGGHAMVHVPVSGLDVACDANEILPMNDQEAARARAEIRQLSAQLRGARVTPLFPSEAPMSAEIIPGIHVQHAMNEIKMELAMHGGITKDRNAPVGGGYAFRGIDDIYNVLCLLTAKHKLNMFPRVVGEPKVTLESYMKNGRGGEKFESTQTHVHLLLDIKLVSAVDGSSELVTTAGEAIDQGDKATNKAMSAAMKYGCIMAFMIPVHGENIDTEAHDVQVAPAAPPPPTRAPRTSRTKATEPAPPEKPAEKVTSREEVMSKLPIAGQVVPKGDSKPPPRTPESAGKMADDDEELDPADFGALDTSDGALDWQIALSSKADAGKTFAELFDIAKEADDKPEPARGVVFDHVCKRVETLIEMSKDMTVLKEAKGLIKALGSPQILLTVYNGKYEYFRQGAT